MVQCLGQVRLVGNEDVSDHNVFIKIKMVEPWERLVAKRCIEGCFIISFFLFLFFSVNAKKRADIVEMFNCEVDPQVN